GQTTGVGKRLSVSCAAPWDAHRCDALPPQTQCSYGGSEGPVRARHNRAVPYDRAMEPMGPLPVNAAQLQSAERCGATKNCALAQGRIFVRVLPGDRQLPKKKDRESRREPKSGPKDAAKNGAPREQEPHRENGKPMPDSAAEQ